MRLLVVEDRHAERPLRDALASAARSGAGVAVLTADALLAMQLRREGVDARLTTDNLTRERVDALDRAALDGVAGAYGDGSPRYACFQGTAFGGYLEYTLIPSFVRAVRNVAAVDRALGGPDRPDAVVLVGGGALVAAARLVARQRRIRTDSPAGGVVARMAHAVARLMAGRATRWVNTEFRALVLEPGFIWLLFVKGFWRRLFAPAPRRADRASADGALAHRGFAHRGFIVIGDRFTADVVERLRGARRIILAGATQPGRALFQPSADLQPIESFSAPGDLWRWVRSSFDALLDAIAMWRDTDHGRQFVVCDVPCWPLVRRSVLLHVPAWTPALRHLQTLCVRAAAAAPRAVLLTSNDVTAYNRVIIDTTRRAEITSVGIQHGIVGQANGHDAVRVDCLAAWGDATERRYREWSDRSREGSKALPDTTVKVRFAVTGNPRFGELARRARERAAVADQPRLADRPFTVTVCTGFVSDFSVLATDYENLQMLDEVLAWVQQHPDAHVIHKMHPGEEAEHYDIAARALGWDTRKLTRVATPTLYDVLERSDVMVASYSTTVLEAAALGTPAIVVDAVALGGYGLLPLDDIGGVTIAKSTPEFHARLTARLTRAHDIVPSPDDPALIDYIGSLDGEAADRIARLIDVT